MLRAVCLEFNSHPRSPTHYRHTERVSVCVRALLVAHASLHVVCLSAATTTLPPPPPALQFEAVQRRIAEAAHFLLARSFFLLLLVLLIAFTSRP